MLGNGGGTADSPDSAIDTASRIFAKRVSTARVRLPLCVQVRSMPGLLERVGAKANLV
jgi:hypothetical protein